MSAIAGRLLDWYDAHARDLPWRARPGANAPEPYRVWLSEIMLQQTTVAAVKPYYEAFLTRWPDVFALAGAEDEDVMRAWAGLGYYSRARNLLKAARAVAALGGFPDTEDGLRALPGVGPYTAAAIAAIAFGRRAVVIDGNVKRVLARLFAIETPLHQAGAAIAKRAEEVTPALRAGDFAQATMDLGAMVCTPRKPRCEACPLAEDCEARRRGIAAELPRKAAKATRPLRRGAAFWIETDDGRVLLSRRPPKGLLGGMSLLPGGDWSEGATPSTKDAPIAAAYALKGEARHVFTHFELRLSVFAARVGNDTPAPEGCRWVAGAALDEEALPSAMRKAVALGRG